jgi:diacylglycerol O-acyltransferase/trehalose O-mycolyltransferase
LKVPDRRVRVLLPNAYTTSCRRYPVLYLLHGVSDTYRTWAERSDVVAFTKRAPLIVVMPDGGRAGQAGWYSDWKDGSRQWETFHTKVLVRFVDRAFRTNGRRAVAGTSMGGFGAMSYAARHRGLYRAAASFSGDVDTMYAAPSSGVFYSAVRDYAGTPGPGVWGDQVSDETTWRSHNPTDRAADLAGTALYIAAGSGTPGGSEGEDPEDPGGYAFEHFIFQKNVQFTSALDRNSVPYTQDLYTGGYHDWPYWQRDLHRALPWLVQKLGAPSACTG